MRFAETLAELMRERGESRYRLAKELGISQTTIKNWLEGKNEPTNHMRKTLDQHYGLTEDSK